MLNEKAGVVFSVAAENPPVPGCTISKAVSTDPDHPIYHFSLAAGTDISPESYDYPKLLLVQGGSVTVFGIGEAATVLPAGALFVTPVAVPIGIRADEAGIYTEIVLRKDSKLGGSLRVGEAVSLSELVPYQPGRIVNMDLVRDSGLKLVLMSFDAGTGLSEHAAPGDALVFALDGAAVIGYEGCQFPIHAGDCFKFDKQARHSVTADQRFKMALLLQL